MTVLTLWFLDKSNTSSFASAASREHCEKSMFVCSGWMPQRVMICGISERTDRMTSAPSPSELLSRLRWKVRCQWALTEKRTPRGRFEGHAAYSRFCSVVLPLRPSARATPPLGPRSLDEILRAWEQRRELRRVNGR